MNCWVEQEPPHGSQLARPRNQTSMADEYGMPGISAYGPTSSKPSSALCTIACATSLAPTSTGPSSLSVSENGP
eukprot:scaffold114853_cov61-Phaeocystis_antarctica.AAC.2